MGRKVADAERDIVPALPRQLVHGDFWDNNVFFRDNRVVLVTDFDFMGERARIDDLALTLYYTNSTFSEDPVSEDRVREILRRGGRRDQPVLALADQLHGGIVGSRHDNAGGPPRGRLQHHQPISLAA